MNMEKKSGIIAFAGLVTGILGIGVALAGSIYYGALFEDVDTASRKNQRDIARIKDSIEAISDRIADMGEQGDVQLAHSGLKEKIRDRNEYRELERIKNELDQIRENVEDVPVRAVGFGHSVRYELYYEVVRSEAARVQV